FYEGEFAAQYVKEAQERGGQLTREDMARWTERAVAAPTAFFGDYHGFQIATEGALSVYALHLCQASKLESLSNTEAVWAQVRILEETFYASEHYSDATHDEFVDREYAEAMVDETLKRSVRRTSVKQFNSNTNILAVRDATGNVAWLTHSINT